jgi:hypothetical protein
MGFRKLFWSLYLELDGLLPEFILSLSKDFAKTGGATRRVAQYILVD